jgi:hypothetical protein
MLRGEKVSIKCGKEHQNMCVTYPQCENSVDFIEFFD